MICLLMLLLATESDEQRVSLTESGTRCSEVVSEVSAQVGTDIELEERLGRIRVTVHCVDKPLDDFLLALSVVLDAKVVKSPSKIRITRNEPVWKMREALDGTYDELAKQTVRDARDMWANIGVLSEQEENQEVIDAWEDARRKEERANPRRWEDNADNQQFRRLQSFVSSPGSWPFSYGCLTMSDSDLEEFFSGKPLVISSTPVPGLPQVKPIQASAISWVFWYESNEYRIRSVRHSLNDRNQYFPMSGNITLVSTSQLEHRFEEYPLHLQQQAERFEDARLEELDRDPEVRTNETGRSIESFYSALAKTGRAVFSLHVDRGSYRTNPDLHVMAGGFIAVKPLYHWKPAVEPVDVRELFSVDMCDDPIKLMDVQAVVERDWNSHVLYEQRASYKDGTLTGVFPYDGGAFAGFWLALEREQKQQVFDDGLIGETLTPLQQELFSRMVYRNFFNAFSMEFPLDYLGPQDVMKCRLKIDSVPVITQRMVNRSGSESRGRLIKHLPGGKFTVWDKAGEVATTINIGYQLEFRFIVGGLEVFDHNGSVVAELARGSTSELQAAIDKFLKERKRR